jgi:two-component system sensor histidine kinase/response regulator
MRSIQFRMTVLIVLALGAAAALVAYFFDRTYASNIQMLASRSISGARNSFQDLQRASIEPMVVGLAMAERNQALREAFMAQDRTALAAEAKPLFERFRTQYGYTQFNFWELEAPGALTPKGLRNVLRVGTPDMFGDVVERPTLARVASQKNLVTGLDLGFTGMSLRALVPATFGGKQIVGYMEMGRDIGLFIHRMKAMTGDDYALLVEKRFMDHKKWEKTRQVRRLADNWDQMKDLLLVDNTTTDASIFEFQGRITDIEDRGTVLETKEVDGKSILRGAFPISDITGTRIGAVFVAQDITAIQSQMKEARGRAVTAVVALCLVLAAVLVLWFRRLVVKRLQRMTEVATRVVGGEFQLEVKQSEPDEIGAFEVLFNQFRTLFVQALGEAEQRSKVERKG